MIRFESDYLEGAHPMIMERLIETNFEQTPGYGTDHHSEKAREYIKKICENPAIDVHFLVGGTQANTTVIASILKPYQGVISASSGHINVHETGAIEATGHKVLSLESTDGKLTAKQVMEAYDAHWNDGTHEHMVQPGMVYISNPTEIGTIYSLKELEELSVVCKSIELPLFMDGARLGYGLMAEGNDITMPDLAKLCDVFYIGGTKVGALFGEAVIISSDKLKKDFRYNIKQRGGMLAKGRLLGIQFETLFEDGLYMEIASEAIGYAMAIKNAFNSKGYEFLINSPTNQQFPILSNNEIDKLSKKYSFQYWQKVNEERSAVRFCTSWATRREQVEELLRDIEQL